MDSILIDCSDMSRVLRFQRATRTPKRVPNRPIPRFGSTARAPAVEVEVGALEVGALVLPPVDERESVERGRGSSDEDSMGLELEILGLGVPDTELKGPPGCV